MDLAGEIWLGLFLHRQRHGSELSVSFRIARLHGISRAAVTADAVRDRPRAPAAFILELIALDVDRYINIIAVAVILKVEIDSVEEIVVTWVHRLLAGLVAAFGTIVGPAGLRRGPVVRLAWLEKFGGVRILLAVAGDILFRRHVHHFLSS